MENKINIAELLRDCPSGMELDCTMYKDVYFDYVDKLNIIHCYIQRETCKTSITFNQHGQYIGADFAKCVIFPKGKTTWDGFQRPFKDGDIVTYDGDTERLQIFIFKDKKENDTLSTCYLMLDGDELDLEESAWYVTRLATEEEKQKLFDAIKSNGYKWNAEIKTLEKLVEPKFKVGDEIVKRNSISNSWIVSSVSSEYYGLKLPKGIEGIGVLPVSEQDDWELVHNKFDINTLKPFDKMLCRQNENCPWIISFFGFYNNKTTYPFICSNGFSYKHCIPYEGNKHLLGTIRDCDEYYKIW